MLLPVFNCNHPENFVPGKSSQDKYDNGRGSAQHTGFEKEVPNTYTNKISDNRMTLVLSAPSVNDPYYRPAFNRIVKFQIQYINAVKGRDNIILIVDSATKSYYDKSVPPDVIIVADVDDIWLRDFTFVNPEKPVQFKYSHASVSKAESIRIQSGFTRLADQYSLKRAVSDYILDGGNIVDDYNGKVVTTTRFASDNNLTVPEAKSELKKILGADQVAVIEPDEDVLAHADGMVMWLENDRLLVNNYSAINSSLRESVMSELIRSFPSVKIVEVVTGYADNSPEFAGFNSACGVNLNSVVTYNYVYVPVFNMPHDSTAVAIIKANTNKKVVQIDASGICETGGSVRCLTLQLTGENAKKLIEAARSE